MKEYEVATEYINPCGGNEYAIRDILEVETDDPVDYVRSRLRGKVVELSEERSSGGSVTVHAVCDGLIQKFVFTPI